MIGSALGPDDVARHHHVVAVIAIALSLALSSEAGAATIEVTTTADDVHADQSCSLREAVSSANSNDAGGSGCASGSPNPAVDSISLPAGTYPVSSITDEDLNLAGDLDVDLDAGPVMVTGTGIDTVTIDAAATGRVVDARGGNRLTIRGLRIAGGRALTGEGAGVRAEAPLSLHSVRLTGNWAAEGGGVYANASIDVDDSIFFDNRADLGGGIRIEASTGDNSSVTDSRVWANFGDVAGGGLSYEGEPGASLTVNGMTFEDNGGYGSGAGIASSGSIAVRESDFELNKVTENVPAPLFGGGISHDASAGPLSVSETTFDQNSAERETSGTALGGAIALTGNAPTGPGLIVHDSTFSRNLLDNPLGGTQRGAAVHLSGGQLFATNVTFSSNRAQDAGGQGGAIYDDGGSIAVAHTTFTANDSAGSGDALAMGAGATGTLRGSLVSDGSSACSAPLSSMGYNLDRGSSCWVTAAAGDVQAVASGPFGLFSFLGDNGGPTRTHALLLNSIAEDRVPSAECLEADGTSVLTLDQRGIPRPYGAGCDAGAHERLACHLEAVTRFGTEGADSISGTANWDVIDGFGGDDVIVGYSSDDVICAGEGDDRVVRDVTFGGGLIDGEAGTDTIEAYSPDAPAPWTIDLAAETLLVPGYSDQVIGIENVIATFFADTITGNDQVNYVSGLAGADSFMMRDGAADVIDCGAGDGALDKAVVDVSGVDTLVNCESDSIDRGDSPLVQEDPPPGAKKCRKGFKLKKTKTKRGAVKKKCVRKKRKRHTA